MIPERQAKKLALRKKLWWGHKLMKSQRPVQALHRLLLKRTIPLGFADPVRSIQNVLRRLLSLVLSTCCGVGLMVTAVQAQSNLRYPERPVRLIVGFQAGASTDMLSRVLAQQLSLRLAQPFVVENKPGAATRIAMDALNKAAPDGYTLAVANAVTTTFGMMFEGMSFEPNKDFVPVTMLGRAPSFVAIKSTLPVKDYKEFAAYARGAKLSFAHPGNGTNPHIAGLALAQSLGMNVIDIAYKGNQPVSTAMAAGEVDFAMLEYETARPLLERGAIRLLAITEPKTYPLKPEIPTGKEVGITMEIEGLTPWFVLLAPPGTPASVVEVLNREVRDILKQPQVKEKLLNMGVEPDSSTPEEAAAYFLAHRQKVTALLKKLNISIKN